MESVGDGPCDVTYRDLRLYIMAAHGDLNSLFVYLFITSYIVLFSSNRLLSLIRTN